MDRREHCFKIDIDKIGIKYQLEQEVKRVNSFRNNVLGLSEENEPENLNIKAYAKYILEKGSLEEKRGLMQSFTSKLILINKRVVLE